MQSPDCVQRGMSAILSSWLIAYSTQTWHLTSIWHSVTSHKDVPLSGISTLTWFTELTMPSLSFSLYRFVTRRCWKTHKNIYLSNLVKPLVHINIHYMYKTLQPYYNICSHELYGHYTGFVGVYSGRNHRMYQRLLIKKTLMKTIS